VASPAFPWWWLALLALVVAIAAAFWRYTRPNLPGIVSTPVDPRAWALAQLGQDGTGGLLASRDLPALTTHVSRVVRTYLGRVMPELGEDLTSTEVVNGLDTTAIGDGASAGLRGILAAADRVKFGLHRPTIEEAERLLTGARAWVSTYPPGGPRHGPGSGGDDPRDPGPEGPVTNRDTRRAA
jgi:hypothetical protein